MMKSARPIIALLCFLPTASEAAVQGQGYIRTLRSEQTRPDFFVATTGSDSNSCRTKADPCATIFGAQIKLRAELAKANGLNRSWLVQIAGGTYPLYRNQPCGLAYCNKVEPLDFRAADSGGSSLNRVTWQAAPGERVAVSGGYKIGAGSGIAAQNGVSAESAVTWTGPDVDGIWTSSIVPKIQDGIWNPQRLWIGDQLRLRPRAPSLTAYLNLGAGGVTSTGGVVPTNYVNTIEYAGTDINCANANPTDWQTYVREVWTPYTARVISCDTPTKKITGYSYIGTVSESFAANAPYFIENVAEGQATQAGTFYIDRTPNGVSNSKFNGTVRYKPDSGLGETDPNNLDIVIPVTDYLMTVSNFADGTSPVQHITFKNIEFAHADWRVPILDKLLPNIITAAITVAGGNDIIFDGVTIRNVGGTGITMGDGCTDCQIINSTIADVGANAINYSSMPPLGNDLNSGALIGNPFPPNMVANDLWAGPNGFAHFGVNWAENVLATSWAGAPDQTHCTSPAVDFQPTYVGNGIEGGIPYIDIRYNGTNCTSASKQYSISSTNIPGQAIGNTYKGSVYIKEAPSSAGLKTGLTYAGMTAIQIHSGGGQTNDLLGSNIRYAGGSLPASGTNLWSNHLTDTQTISDSDVTALAARLYVTVPSGGTVDVTIRYGAPTLYNWTYALRGVASATGPLGFLRGRITNNLVYGCGRSKTDSACVNVTEAHNFVIEANDISNGFAPAIWFGYFAPSGGSNNCGHPVRGNGYTNTSGVFVPDTCNFTSNVTVRWNYLHHQGIGVGRDYGMIHMGGNSIGSEIYGNVIDDSASTQNPTEGVYADNGTSNVKAYNNIISRVDGACFFHNPGVNVQFYNNICYDVERHYNQGWFRGTMYSIGNTLGTVNNVGDSVHHNVVYWLDNAGSNLPRFLGIGATLPSDGFQPSLGGSSQHDNVYDYVIGSTHQATAPANIIQSGVPTSIVNPGGTQTALTWAEWQSSKDYGNGNVRTYNQDAGSTWANANWSGTPPYVSPAVTPSGWSAFDATIAGLYDKGRTLKIPTPVNPYPPGCAANSSTPTWDGTRCIH